MYIFEISKAFWQSSCACIKETIKNQYDWLADLT